MPGLDLWPPNLAELIGVEPKDSPKSILQQQAQFLGEKFGGKLRGSVDTVPFKEPAKPRANTIYGEVLPESVTATVGEMLYGQSQPVRPDFMHIFKVVVPDLDDYEFDLLEIRGRATPLYPVQGVFGDKPAVILKTKAELTAWLKTCFASPRAREILNSLLAHAGH